MSLNCQCNSKKTSDRIERPQADHGRPSPLWVATLAAAAIVAGAAAFIAVGFLRERKKWTR